MIDAADTFFPVISENKWKLVSAEKHRKDEKHPFDYTFEVYQKNR